MSAPDIRGPWSTSPSQLAVANMDGDTILRVAADWPSLPTCQDRRAVGLVAAAAPDLLVALQHIFAELDKGDGNAPGHGHDSHGIWNDDVSNGSNAGNSCDWCAKWNRAKSAIARATGAA